MPLVRNILLCTLLFALTATADTSHTGIRKDINGLQFASEMTPGVNLWNTLDAYCDWLDSKESEKCWGQPLTTKAMITDFRKRGFKTLRLPVTWYSHMGPKPNYVIEKWWLDRVEEIANFAFDNDMYVIINIHHDDLSKKQPGSWLVPTYAKKTQTIDRLEKVWTQIATRFKEYGDHLVFETMNEPRAVDTPQEWTGGSPEHRDMVNQLNLAAVNAIRATGGNNKMRFIMTPQVGAHGKAALEALVIPNNDKRILVSIHNYNPFNFTLKQPGIKNWGTQKEKEQLTQEFKAYYDHFVAKGQAVILGEWGAADKGNLKDRIEYYKTVSAAVKKYQITPIAWIYDYDRKSRTWKNPEIEDAILLTTSP